MITRAKPDLEIYRAIALGRPGSELLDWVAQDMLPELAASLVQLNFVEGKVARAMSLQYAKDLYIEAVWFFGTHLDREIAEAIRKSGGPVLHGINAKGLRGNEVSQYFDPEFIFMGHYPRAEYFLVHHWLHRVKYKAAQLLSTGVSPDWPSPNGLDYRVTST